MAQLDNLLALFLMGKSNMQNMGKRCPSCQDKEGNLFILPTRLSIAGGTTAGDIPALPPLCIIK